jgi:DNA-binding response OmpR family regulator
VSMTIAPSYGGEPSRARRELGEPEADECPICSHKHREELRGWIPPKEILVAEDEPSVARLIAYNLEQDGYRVTIAGDGVTALRVLRERPPDLLVLDLLLPLQSGWQVLRALRSQGQPRGSHLPVLIVSALGCERLERQLSVIGAQRVLGKPFSVEELRAIVRELLDAHPPTGRPVG